MPFFDPIRIGSGASTGYEVERSLRLNRTDNAKLSKTFASAGNRKKWTWSGWVKFPDTLDTNTNQIFSYQQGHVNHRGSFYKGSSGVLNYQLRVAGSHKAFVTTNAQLRDPGAWYHIVLAIDSDQGSSNDRVKIYINGVLQTDVVYHTTPASGFETWINSTQTIYLGAAADENGGNMYLAEINFIDGQAYDPSYFGETNSKTGQWVPKKYTGSYTGNSFYLNFSDNSNTTDTTLGADSSGLGNNWTPANFSVSAGTGNDSLEDTPTNNFCTLSTLDISNGGSLREGGLTLYTDSNDQAATGTFGITSGKWYWEVDKNSTEPEIGIAHFQMPLSNKGTSLPSDGQITFIVAGADSNTNFLRVNGSTTTGTGMSAQTGTGSLGIALDMDNKKIWWSDLSGNYFNSGNPATGANAQVDFSSTGEFPNGVTPIVCIYQGSGNTTSINFGQRPFTHTAPTGFKTLCSENLPDPTIKLPNKHFDIDLYTGTGSTLERSAFNFQPDWLWFKSRSASGHNHALFDSVRGRAVGLSSDENYSEFTSSASNDLVSFDDDGFTIGGNQNFASVNGTGTKVVWAWKGGGAASSNSDGTITTSISANPTAGFSIVTWTGTGSAGTIGHGLGVAPKWLVVKLRSGSQDWFVNNGMILSDLGKYFKWNDGSVNNASDTNVFPNTAPTSTVFSVGTDNAVNGNGDTYVAYVFSEVAGYSKFGTYTGNGNANGPFIHCGFRPAFLMVKLNGNDNWYLVDYKRDPFNVMDHRLFADTNGAEGAVGQQHVDFVSNGFKWRKQKNPFNNNGNTYIFLAFAESPFKYARAR